MTTKRLGLCNAPGPVMSGCMIHGNMLYLAGDTASDLLGDVTAQVTDVLGLIDKRLGEAGTDRRKLTSQARLGDMVNFAATNVVWNYYVDPEIPPSRICGALLRLEALVIIVVLDVIEA